MDEKGGSTSDSCKVCGFDFYSEKEGATKKSDCIPCGQDEDGKDLTTGTTDDANNIRKCAKEDIPSCPGAQRRQNADAKCKDCPKGYHGDGRGESCLLCSAPLGFSKIKQHSKNAMLALLNCVH